MFDFEMPQNNSAWSELRCSVTHTELKIESAVKYSVLGIYIVEFLIGIIDNLMVILVCLSDKQNRSPTTVFMVNLSFADFLVCSFVLPATAFMLISKEGWIFGPLLCKLTVYSQNVTVFISIYTMVAMSVDRFLAIVYAIESIAFRTYQNAFRTIVIIWIATLVLNSPLLFMTGIRMEASGALFCEPNYDKYVSSGFQIYVIFIILMAYFLPLFAISCLYCILVRSLWKNRGIQQSEDSLKSRRKVTKMVIIVVILFAVSLLPLIIVYLIQSLGLWDRCSMSQYIFVMFAYVAFYFNNICNPLVYAFKSENIQKSMIRTFPLLAKYKKNPQVHIDLNERTTFNNSPNHTRCLLEMTSSNLSIHHKRSARIRNNSVTTYVEIDSPLLKVEAYPVFVH